MKDIEGRNYLCSNSQINRKLKQRYINKAEEQKVKKTVQLPLKFFFREFFVEENETFSLILPHAKAILTAAWKTWSYKTKKDNYFNLLKGNTNLGREKGTFLVDERRSKTILLLLQQQQQQRADICMTYKYRIAKATLLW